MIETNKTKLADSAAPIPSVTFLREEYFNEGEAARALDRAPITLAIWRTQRKGPPVTRIGRRVYYKKSSLRTWVAAQEGPPTTFGAHATA